MARLDRRAILIAGSLAPFMSGPAAWTADALDPVHVYERETGGRMGLYAENLVTGASFAWRADELFVMCSTFKFSLAALALARADGGALRLDEPIRYGRENLEDYAPVARKNLDRGGMTIAEMCEAAVEWSDNTCANLVLARVGGPPALTSFWRATGDRTSRLDHNEPLLNRSPPGDPHDATTPSAMAGNLRRFLLGDVLSPASRDLLRRWMIASKTGGDRLRAGLPPDWQAGDKTGTNGKDAFGDIAVAWPKPDRPVVICAYAQGGSPAAPQVRTVFTEIGRMIGQRLA